MQPSFTADPVRFEFDAPERVQNWRPLVHWILAIPHWIVLYLLNIAMEVVWVISWFTVLFTKRIPPGLYQFQVMGMRYAARTYSYIWFMREPYPAFDFTTSEQDPGTDPAVRFSIDRPEEVSRWTLLAWFLAIPHYIVLFVYGLGAFFVLIAAFFVVLFTGKFPPGMRDYVVKVMRYAAHIYAYVLMLRDEYPSFSLQ